MNESEIFHAAIKLTPELRQNFLDAACAGNQALKEGVQALLRESDEMDSFIEKPAVKDLPTDLFRPITESPGTTIGPYKLMEQIGEGGFGLVFVAEQHQPVRRKVALKIIKPGMDTREVIARFEAERQALALMDHPNIARVFDAGTTDSGRPYFVMELVKGIPITDYCDQQHLTARQRLELFLSVSQAVQHAHTKGIIHRDIKPSNILVAPHDGVPVIKVIDFGVAKAIGQQLTDKTIYTRFTQMIGTPLYMSPEQAEINALDVDTRSDVYSLGVLLYELLTGTTPIDRQRLSQAAYDEIRRIIKEEEPPKPSTRLSTMGETLSQVSNCRNIEPSKLSALVKGDLDWIVMKALEKDRTRRYETATSFAADVRRFLAEEAIEARPPSAWYRFQKVAKRNRFAIATAALVAASLLIGLAGTTWQAYRASQSERVARANEKVALESEKKAIVERDAKEKALEKEAEQRNIALVALDRAIEAEKQSKAKEQLLAEERDRAIAAQTESKAFSDFLVRRFLSASRPSGQDGGQGVDLKMSEAVKRAESHIEEDFEGQPAAESIARHAIGLSYYYRSDLNAAYLHLAKSLELSEKVRGTADLKTLEIMLDNGLVLGQLKQHHFAAKLFTSVVEGLSKLKGPNDSDTLAATMNLADAYRSLGKLEESIELHRETFERLKSTLGPDDKKSLYSGALMARTYLAQGGASVDTAISLLEDAAKRSEAKFSIDNPMTMFIRMELALGYIQTERAQSALTILEDLYPRSSRVKGKEHSETLNIRDKLIRCLFKVDRAMDAMKLFDQEYRDVLAVTKSHDAMPSRLVQAKVIRECEAAGYYEGIVEFYEKILSDLRKHLPSGHLGFASWMDIIGYNLLRQGEWDHAEEILLECHKIRSKERPTSWDTFKTESMLGAVRKGQKEYSEAEALLISGYEGMVREERSRPRFLSGQVPERLVRYYTDAIDRLIEIYVLTEKPDEVRKWESERGKYTSAQNQGDSIPELRK